jgi:hypothetical protein
LEALQGRILQNQAGYYLDFDEKLGENKRFKIKGF